MTTTEDQLRKLETEVARLRPWVAGLDQSRVDWLRWRSQEPGAGQSLHPIYTQLDDVQSLVDLVSRCEQAVEDARHAIEEAPEFVQDELRSLRDVVSELHSRVFGTDDVAPPTPKRGPIPQSADDATKWKAIHPAWRLGSVDRAHPRAWLDLDGDVLERLVSELSTFESMTWTEIEEMPHSHPWASIDEWQAGSRDRLADLQYDDQQNWYQLQTDRMGRVFGFRSGHVLHVVWWDRHHEVYVTGG